MTYPLHGPEGRKRPPLPGKKMRGQGGSSSDGRVEGSHQRQRGLCEIWTEKVPQTTSVVSPFLGFMGTFDISEQEAQRRGYVGPEMVFLTPRCP